VKKPSDYDTYADIFAPDGNREINLSKGTEERMQPISKMYDCELKAFSDEGRSFTAIASTESKDREGDILKANGWKLKNFRKNPVLLWAHDASGLPIGKAVNIDISDGKMFFDAKFATQEMNPLAEQVWQMFKAGFLRAFSVRFDPITWEDAPPEAGKSARVGRIYKSQELLEISAVNIPANAEALKSPAMYDLLIKSYVNQNAPLFPGFSKQETFECECIECGHKIKSEKHCKDLKCSECGGQMRRAGRPGPGQASYENSEVINAKTEKLESLKREKELKETESKLDAEIAALEKDLQNDKAKEEIAKQLKALQDGITGLVTK